MTRLFGRTLAPDDLGDCLVTFEGDRIAAVEPMDQPPADALGGRGALICPGFIDLQVNGAFGEDFSEPQADLATVRRRLPESGVTAFLATVISSSVDSYAACLTNLRRRAGDGGAEVLGVHLEGPFLAAKYAGTHDRAVLRAPDPNEAAGWLSTGDVRIVTLAPELPGAGALLALLRRHGVVAAAGHTGAGWREAETALVDGIGLGTHLFNAMRPFRHRDPGIAGLLLIAPIPVSVIADGVHLAPESLRVISHAKGPDGLIVVTDGLAGLGMAPGAYRLAGRQVISDGTVARLRDGTLSGSVTPMNRAVAGLARAGLPASLAVRAATANPARLLGLADERGHLGVGCRADVVLLRADWEVSATFVAGRSAFASSELAA